MKPLRRIRDGGCTGNDMRLRRQLESLATVAYAFDKTQSTRYIFRPRPMSFVVPAPPTSRRQGSLGGSVLNRGRLTHRQGSWLHDRSFLPSGNVNVQEAFLTTCSLPVSQAQLSYATNHYDPRCLQTTRVLRYPRRRAQAPPLRLRRPVQAQMDRVTSDRSAHDRN